MISSQGKEGEGVISTTYIVAKYVLAFCQSWSILYCFCRENLGE
jgi:hypothetical protein